MTVLIAHVSRLTTLLAALPMAASALRAQVLFERDDVARIGCAMAFHAPSQTYVRFGGVLSRQYTILAENASAATWLLDATGTWTSPSLPLSPPPRFYHSLTMFPPTGELLLFGGRTTGGAELGDLWTWNGTLWSPYTIGSGPSPRALHGAAYDPSRSRLVVQGGERAGLRLGDTWEFDGTTWTSASPALAPPAGGGAMAFDPVTQRVAFLPPGPPIVWEWDGTTWTGIAAANGNHAGIHGHTFVTDPSGAGVLLIGGEDFNSALATSHLARWNGTDFVDFASAEAGRRTDHAAAVDPTTGTVLLFGGDKHIEGHFTAFAQTWQRALGGAWSLHDEAAPASRFGASLDALPNGDLLLVGGSDNAFGTTEVWRYDGQWQPMPTLPVARHSHATAYDRARDRLVLFGGSTFSVPTGDPTASNSTYEWDGTNWLLRATTGPIGLLHPSMAYDADRRVVVMFGGFDPTNTLTTLQTWEWDGIAWTLRPTATTPPTDGPMTYVAALGRIAMLASVAGTPVIWTYDGIDWAPWTTAPGFGTIAVDDGRDRLVLLSYAGADEFDGASWLHRDSTHVSAYFAPAGPTVHARARGETFAFQDGGIVSYGPVHRATVASIGDGCPGSLGLVALAADNDPYLGNDWRLLFAATNPGVIWAGPRLIAFGQPAPSWSGLPLPIDLGAIGMPGCLQRVPIDFLATTGSDAFHIVVPPLPHLIGVQVDAQALLPDPVANPIGLITTSAIRGVVGSP